jgi:hypothetical protein
MCIDLRAELLRYGRMGMPADVYAFGITMWELYTGQVGPWCSALKAYTCKNSVTVGRMQQQQHLMLQGRRGALTLRC